MHLRTETIRQFEIHLTAISVDERNANVKAPVSVRRVRGGEKRGRENINVTKRGYVSYETTTSCNFFHASRSQSVCDMIEDLQ